jgi:hypothetical protein
MENTSIAQQWIYANHIENTTSSVVVFTALLHRNGSCQIIACIFIVAGMCSQSRCLAMVLHVNNIEVDLNLPLTTPAMRDTILLSVLKLQIHNV